MKKGCLGCLLPAILIVLLGLAVILPLMISVGASINSSSSLSSTPSAPPSSLCGTSTVNVPQRAVPWMAEAEKTSGIPAAWFAAIADRESDFRPDIYAYDRNGGTWGLFQLNREEWSKVYPDASANGTGTPPGITDPMIHSHYAGIYFKNRLATVQKMKANHPEKEFAKLSDLEALAVAHNAGEGTLQAYPHITPGVMDYLKEIQSAYKPQPCNAPPAPPGPGNNGLFGVDDYAPVRRGREGVDDWAFFWGECVSYVAFMIRTHTPHADFHNLWRDGKWRPEEAHFGHAKMWDERAKAVGVRVDTTPAVGAVAQHSRNDHGHVAYITNVYEDGTFDINEYNHGPRHKFGTRTRVSIPKDFDVILHFEE